MVNCPKCGTPNPDSATLCLACSAPLEGQKFAQALDKAQATLPPADSVGGEHGQGRTHGAADFPPTDMPSGIGQMPTETVAGTANEADRYFAQSRAKKRQKRIIGASISLVAIIVAGVFFYRDAQQQKMKKAAASFMNTFMDVDNGQIAGFWRCLVGAKRKDIHRAPDNLVVTSGIETAFSALPQRMPDRIRRKCLPMLDAADAELQVLRPIAAFNEPLDDLRKQLKKVKHAVDALALKMDKVKDLAANEAKVIEAAHQFHAPTRANENTVAGYVNLLSCAVPTLGRMVRRVRQAPDTQELIEFIFSSCKGDPSYADQLRSHCFDKLNDSAKSRIYRLVLRKMSGDNRDISAIEHCFRRANKDVLGEELAAVGKTWVGYRNAIKRIINRAAALRGESAQSADKTE